MRPFAAAAGFRALRSNRPVAMLAARGIAVVLLLASLGPAPAAAREDEELARRVLRSHGVEPSRAALVALLETGWDPGDSAGDWPADPAIKSLLLADAWKLLALDYASLRADPEISRSLSGLSLQYASARFPAGVLRTLEEDLRRIDARSRERVRAITLDLLQRNGMVAVGLFTESAPPILADARRVYDAEKRLAVRLQYAMPLALLGDAEVLEDLILEIALANRTTSVAAAYALSDLVGRSFGLEAYQAVEPRREEARNILRWWQGQRETGPVAVDRDAALARALRRSRTPPPVYLLGSIRDLLRASADHQDATDKRGSRTAWNQLDEAGASLVPRLLPILLDSGEDLDVRSEAIRWYARLEGKRSKRTLKRLRKDPNPEIAALARQQLASLKKWSDSAAKSRWTTQVGPIQ